MIPRTTETDRMRLGTRRRAMTLIEVILAVSILSIGLTALLTAVSQCLAVMKNARSYQTAQWVMDIGDAEHPLLTNDLAAAAVEPVDYKGFTYSREVENDDDEDNLYVVRTRVTWADGRGPASHEVVRYILDWTEKK